MIGYDLEIKFYHSILGDARYITDVHPQYFEHSDVSKSFKIAKKFVSKYKRTPSYEQMKILLKKYDKENEISEESLKTLYDSKEVEYDKDWYKTKLEKWITLYKFENGIENGLSYYKRSNINEDNIDLICNETLKIINQNTKISFTDKVGLDIFDPDSHYYDDDANRFPMGYEYFDRVSGGGITKGELWVGVGESNVGKSIWLSNMAKLYMDNGFNVAYISCEMGGKKVIRRIGSNMFTIPMKKYFAVSKDSNLMKDYIKKYKEQLSENILSNTKVGKLIIEDFPSSTLTTIGLEGFLLNVENTHKIKFDVVILDYINIMSNWRNPNSENTYMKIKQISEDLRALASTNDWGVISMTQAKLDAYNSSDIKITHTSESSALIHTCDLIFGIIQTTEMWGRNKYNIKLLKNREEGWKNSVQEFDVAYDYMRITQSDRETII